MRITGVVCEYNPFHSGHKYQLDMSRGSDGEDNALVCVMSGDFVQRGDAAIYSKFARAEAACCCGADVVIELPLPWSLAPAETFARGAISLLSSLGADELSFGSECGDAELLSATADALLDPRTDESIKYIMKEYPEIPYALARERAVEFNFGEAVSCLLRQPNNILGIEYIKAIRVLASEIKISTVKRIGSGHDEKGDSLYRSASELRGLISNGADVSDFVPDKAREVYIRERQRGRELSDRTHFETAVLSRLRMLPEEAFFMLPDGEEGLCRRIYRAVRTESSLSSVYDAAKTKRYSHARIRRLCISAALGMTRGLYPEYPPYARILAVNERGRACLREISPECTIPLITKAADIRQYSQCAQEVFAVGANAHDMYVLAFGKNCPIACGEDWRISPAIVKNQ